MTMRRPLLAIGASLALIAGILTIPPAPAATADPGAWRTAPARETSVPGKNFKPHVKPADPQAAAVLRHPPAVIWPSAGSEQVTAGQAGSLPVYLSSHTPVRVEVADRATASAAGATGLLVSLHSGVAGKASVGLDYSSFRNAYGGDWATRLRVVQLPECALSSPAAAECTTGTPLRAYNNVQAGRITADVTLSTQSTVLALTTAPSGSAGDYKATALSASSSWQAGSAAGEFSWNYPMDTPDGLGGPEPDLSLAYSFGSIDGRVASTNNQSSWVGDGWDIDTGFIERRYKSCYDDVTTTPKPQDLCWETDNAVLSLGAKTVELVKDDTTGAWHPRDDDGARVEKLTGTVNGAKDGEYWRVTTVDGTQYYFGLNHLPGWVTGNEETKSTWTVPVFGNDAGEPCHATTFATSYCNQAWRWNLDYVVDTHGNAMSSFYTPETNYYGRNLTATAGTAYIRGGTLKRLGEATITKVGRRHDFERAGCEPGSGASQAQQHVRRWRHCR
jgi:hypothetical protein